MERQGKFILMTVGEFETWLLESYFFRPIKRVQNHHTWIPDYSHFYLRGVDPHFPLLRSMERSHEQRGMREIAQNITTFPDGMVAICRNFERMPAGVRGANLHAICIEHVGNFDVGGDEMSAAHRETIIAVNALLCRKFRLIPGTQTIVYHHWYDLNTGRRVREGVGETKSCPGTNFFGGNTVEECERGFVKLVEFQLENFKLKMN